MIEKDQKQHEAVKDESNQKGNMKEPGLKERHDISSQEKSMREMAAGIVRHHLTPAPGAELSSIDPFPAPVIGGLVGGFIGGALVGLLVAALMVNYILVVPGWEGLFSMTPATFYTFWAGMGAAVGILLGGITAIHLTNAR